jgi:hypothetical protein
MRLECDAYHIQGRIALLAKWLGGLIRKSKHCRLLLQKRTQISFATAFAEVLRMLYKNANCCHIEELQTIMNSCDASILDDIPDEIGKLSEGIVRKWWALHGFLYVMELFCITPEVRMFFACCDAWRLC